MNTVGRSWLARLVLVVAAVATPSLACAQGASSNNGDAVARRLIRQVVGHSLAGGPGALNLHYLNCVECDWSDLPTDAYVAFFLRGKADKVDLYLDYATERLKATLEGADYWQTILAHWIEMDEAGRPYQAKGEGNAARVLELAGADRDVVAGVRALRRTLTGSAKYQLLNEVAENVRRVILAELRKQPQLVPRFASLPAPLPELTKARKILAAEITK